MVDPLYAVSPLDGRYSALTKPLVPYASEAALMRARTEVEIEYLIALADLEAVPLELGPDERETLRSLVTEFDATDAELIKRIETQGHGEQPATNHDVKAIEYFLRERIELDTSIDHWIHFGLTSEDVNNLAHRLLLAEAITEVLRPTLETLRGSLGSLADSHRELAMLSRTHGQPATPTTFGKELAVYAHRLGGRLDRLDRAADDLSGKLSGATGTYGAHTVAFPEVDWPAFSREFVTHLGFEHEPLTAQINPCDDLAELFDAFRRINSVLIDLDRDMWMYISRDYLGQEPVEGETGSSTMPHKVNPIDFENSEGNLSKANADLVFLGDYVTTSRMQRDLSDSTVKRNIGTAFSHCLIGYSKLSDGLATIVPNEQIIQADLAAHPEVLTEAIQTILRREGFADAYERVKEITRGETIDPATLDTFVSQLDIAEPVKAEIRALSPETYTGVASDLPDELAGPD